MFYHATIGPGHVVIVRDYEIVPPEITAQVDLTPVGAVYLLSQRLNAHYHRAAERALELETQLKTSLEWLGQAVPEAAHAG